MRPPVIPDAFIPESGHHLTRIVFRSVIDDDQLEIHTLLLQNASDAILQERTTVICR
jgi:hypothetical protein